MIDTQSLRGKILDRALHGELTCQLPEDGTGAQLYQEIIEKRKELSKAGRIKNLKKLPEVSEDEWLFEIPQSWKWIRLGNVASIFGGKRIPAGRKLTTEDTGHKYIRVSEMKNETVIIEDMLYVPEDIYPSISQYIINKEDVYITVAGTIGRVGKIPEEIDGANLTENADRIVFDMIDQDWLISCLSSSEIQKEISLSTTQVAQPKLAIKRIEDLIIPLPPLNEQKRMVHILNQVFPILDTINALQDQYASNQEALKSKLIDAAIQGKLTDQLSEDGNVSSTISDLLERRKDLVNSGDIRKKKILPEIEESEYPFEIPRNWKWVHISDVWAIINGDRGKNYPAKSTLSHEGIPFISALNLDGTTVVADDKLMCLSDEQYEKLGSGKLRKGDVVVCIRGSLGKHGKYPFDKGAIASSLIIARNYIQNEVINDYLMVYLDSQLFRDEIKKYNGGSAQPNLAAESLEKFRIPFPPVDEQLRIVNRVSELLERITE